MGDEYQGKTTLLHFLMNKKPPKEKVKRTDGIDIHIWQPKQSGDKREIGDDSNDSDNNVTISAWNFAGQRVRIDSVYYIL